MSISSEMGASTANPRSAALSQLPSYRRAADMLMAMMETLLLSLECTTVYYVRTSIMLYQRAAYTTVSTSLLYNISTVCGYAGDFLVRELMSC